MRSPSFVSIAALHLMFGCQPDSTGAASDTAINTAADSAKPDIALTVWSEAQGGGSISPAGETRVDAGQTITFALTPDDGHAVASVSGTCGGQQQDASFTTAPIEGNCTVIALFEAVAPEPAAYCSGTPAEQADVVVCDPDQNLDDWSTGRSYWTTDLRIPSGKVLSLPFTANATGLVGIVEITNNMPGLNASGMFWRGWFSAVPGGDLVEDSSSCQSYSANPNPDQLKWNQTAPADWECHLGTTSRTLYFNMEVRCFEELSSVCTPGERYSDDYWLGVSAVPID